MHDGRTIAKETKARATVQLLSLRLKWACVRNRKILLGLFMLALAIEGASVIFSLAGIRLGQWLKLASPPASELKERAGIVQAAIAWFAGMVTLATFLLDRMQKQEHFEFERAQERFMKLVESFSSSDERARKNSLVQFVQMAKMPYPGMPDDCSARNYPFYRPAVDLLCGALAAQVCASERLLLEDAIKTLAEFDKSGRQDLLKQAIQAMSKAHRLTSKELGRHLANWDQTNGENPLVSRENLAGIRWQIWHSLPANGLSSPEAPFVDACQAFNSTRLVLSRHF